MCGSGATPMATLTDADIGRRVSVTNSAGEVFQGTVFTVDSGVVMLEQFTNSNTAVTRANYTMVNAAAITNVAEVAPAPSVAADHPLPPPDAEYLRAREERAIARATAEADNINVKASTRFQAVYDALSKTMPCEWGSDPRNPAKVTVLVLGNVRAPTSRTSLLVAATAVAAICHAGTLTRVLAMRCWRRSSSPPNSIRINSCAPRERSASRSAYRRC